MPKAVSLTVICPDWDGVDHEVTIDQLRWRPAAYAIVIKDGKVLLSRQYGIYTIPGGGIELGETPEEGVIRETKEETGFIIGNPRLITCRSSYYKMTGSEKGEFIQSIMLFYACDLLGGAPSTDFMMPDEREDGDLPEWISLDRLDRLPVKGSFNWRQIVQDFYHS